MLEKKLLGYQRELNEAEQILGSVLGYPKYKDDPTNFPDATDADGVCVGEHTVVTLAMEAAQRLTRQHDGAQGVDLPDSPGWWAFKGFYFNLPVEWVGDLVEWSIDGDMIRYKFSGDAYANLQRKIIFMQGYNGKWYRLQKPCKRVEPVAAKEDNSG